MFNRRRYSIRVALLCTSQAIWLPAFANDACGAGEIGVHQGMVRAEIERRVAELREETSSYNVYRNGLRGGSVEYRWANCVLTVDYAPGMLPPWVIGPDGVAQHLAPIDESVQKFVLKVAAGEIKK